jgi:hypothetical protein
MPNCKTSVTMKKALFIILAFALLSGCNTVNMAYRNADWYLEHRINEYATFNDRQKEIIRQDVSGYVRWHRQKMLPDYISFLQDLNRETQYNRPLKVADATRLRTSLQDLYRATMQPMIAPAAQILAGMDTAQIAELERHFAAENEERKQEMLGISRDDYLEKRGKSTLSFMHWLAGSLSTEQERKILELSRSPPTTGEIYLQQREEHQRKLIAMLKNHAGETDIASFLTAWLFTPDEVLSAEQQDAVKSSGLAWDRMIVQIHWLLTSTQKQHINDLVSTYIREMAEENRSSPQSASP